MTHPTAVNCGWKWKENDMKHFKLKSRLWIVDEHDNIIMGEGRKEIFENIDKTGSINKTAKVMKMSYKAVWGKIKASEKHAKASLVHADRKTGTRQVCPSCSRVISNKATSSVSSVAIRVSSSRIW